MSGSVFNNPASKIVFNGLSIKDAEILPKFYWFNGGKHIGKRDGFSLVTKITDIDNGSKEYLMRDDYYYRGKDEMKFYYKLYSNPFIAKMVRTCKENPKFNITLKIYPFFNELNIKDVRKKGMQDELKFEKFGITIENQSEKLISKFYVNVMKDLANEINSRNTKKTIN